MHRRSLGSLSLGMGGIRPPKVSSPESLQGRLSEFAEVCKSAVSGKKMSLAYPEFYDETAAAAIALDKVGLNRLTLAFEGPPHLAKHVSARFQAEFVASKHREIVKFMLFTFFFNLPSGILWALSIPKVFITAAAAPDGATEIWQRFRLLLSAIFLPLASISIGLLRRSLTGTEPLFVLVGMLSGGLHCTAVYITGLISFSGFFFLAVPMYFAFPLFTVQVSFITWTVVIIVGIILGLVRQIDPKVWLVDFFGLVSIQILLNYMSYQKEQTSRLASLNRELLTSKDIELHEEVSKTNALLRSAIPEVILEKLGECILKNEDCSKKIAQEFDVVTVMFCEITNFHDLSSTMEESTLVGALNIVYSEFDKLLERFRLHKVETIGQIYMLAGGCPEVTDEFSKDVAILALKFMETMPSINLKVLDRIPGFDKRLQLRIGINTGPIVAGIVGTRMPRYKLFGDTVNTASRMQSTCEIGRIQISQSTFELLQNDFDTEYRGKVMVKGKGHLETYYLLRSKQQTNSAETSLQCVTDSVISSSMTSVFTPIMPEGVLRRFSSGSAQVHPREAKVNNGLKRIQLSHEENAAHNKEEEDRTKGNLLNNLFLVGMMVLLYMLLYIIFTLTTSPEKVLRKDLTVWCLAFMTVIYGTMYCSVRANQIAKEKTLGRAAGILLIVQCTLLLVTESSLLDQPYTGRLLCFLILSIDLSIIPWQQRLGLCMFNAFTYAAMVLSIKAVNPAAQQLRGSVIVNMTIPVSAWNIISSSFNLLSEGVVLLAVIVSIEQQTRSNFFDQRLQRVQQRLIIAQKKHTAKMLLKLLPESVVPRLLSKGSEAVVDHFEEVSILFTDMVQFTAFAQRLKAYDLMCFLNEMYVMFDAISSKYGLYKVEIIGDAYFAVGGCPVACTNHVDKLIHAALEMTDAVEPLRLKAQQLLEGYEHAEGADNINIRVGVHVGAVVAGVIGVKDPRYHVFGEAVNLAQVMESTGEPGKVHISRYTYELLQSSPFLSHYTFEQRSIGGSNHLTVSELSYFVNITKRTQTADVAESEAP